MKFLIICFTVSFIYLFGCGSDSTTNNGNTGNGETVIFSMDSLSIYLNSSIVINDTLFDILNSPSIKIDFNCQTNADSVNSFALFRIIAGDSNIVYKDTSNNNISSLNNNHTIYISASNTFTLSILIQLNRTNNLQYFMKLKNIKVIKI
ncbi:MAG: hypothetical protein J0M37_08560 [Ignavibacteria bacterium]|nr:hypothetical protein [Ignavibacteria bacterium]